jgi:hypothetical protein
MDGWIVSFTLILYYSWQNMKKRTWVLWNDNEMTSQRTIVDRRKAAAWTQFHNDS